MWSFVVLPDTQIYARQHPELLEAQTRWIAAHAQPLGIAFVLHVGDLVDGPSDAQWSAVSSAFAHLDGHVPYALAAGNHDCGPRGCASDRRTRLPEWFPPSRLGSALTGCFEPGQPSNAHYVFETPAGPWQVLALEFGPRPSVLRWADEVLRRHAGVPGILLTHAYLYSDGTRYDATRRPEQKWSPHVYGISRTAEGACDGEAVFQRLVRHHPQVHFVLCGHVLNEGVARRSSLQRGGGVVHQLLANYQHRRRGGDGFLRRLELDDRARRCRVRTYSPALDTFKKDPANDFTLALWPPPT